MRFKILNAVLVISGIAAAGSFSGLIPLVNQWEWQFMDVSQLADGSFAVTLASVMEDLILLHLSPEGELLFEQDGLSVPGRSLESGGWIIPSARGGCFVVAYSEPRATGADSDIALFKLSAECDIEWTVQIGKNTDAVFTCFGAAGSDDDGVVILGGKGFGGESSFVRKYSSDGELLWEYAIDFEVGYLPAAIGQVNQGNLVLMGHQWLENTYLQKLDCEGSLEWELELPFKCGFGATSFFEIDNGYCVFFGDRDDSGSGVIAVADYSGSCIETSQISHGMLVNDAFFEDDCSIILAGKRVLDGENNAVIDAFDAQGNQRWERSLNGYGEDGFAAVCRAGDEGYALLGYSFSEDEQGSGGAVFIVTESDGQVSDGSSSSEIPFPQRTIEALSLVPEGY